MEIKYWADIACPYCYMGVTQLQRALKELEIADETQLEFMSFQLDPTLPITTNKSMTEYYAQTHNLTSKEALSQLKKLIRWLPTLICQLIWKMLFLLIH